jgi:hypothetical protein
MVTASLLAYWSAKLMGGRQTGDIVRVNVTGDSIVRRAMSLYCTSFQKKIKAKNSVRQL